MVGGLRVSRLSALFTTSVVYIYIDRLAGWLGRRRHPNSARDGHPPRAKRWPFVAYRSRDRIVKFIRLLVL